MSFEVIAIPRFKRDLKKLVKRYPSLREEFIRLVEHLIENPTEGIPLGNDCFKIRLFIASKGKGKSGGARVVTYVLVKQEEVYLLTIFDKSDNENIPNSELRVLLGMIP
jgi:mRNA-degrading endonuclease RelE of RelBE toxin-antitoxin system